MRKIYSIIAMAGVLFSAVSCASDDAMQGAAHEGAVKFKIGVEDQLMTRATNDEIIADAKVMIYKPAFEGLIREYKYSELPEYVYLPATTGTDKYRIDVYVGERVKDTPTLASFDSKSYKGSAEFAVAADVVSTSAVEVVANICNVVTKVSFDQSVADAFESGYGLTVGYDNNTLTYAAADSGKDGYFIIADDAFEPEFTWNFAGKLNKDGSEFKSSGKFTVEQGKRYVMSLKYVEKDGTLKFVVQVDKSLSEKNDQITFVPTSTGISTTKKYDIWASHITLRADVDEAEYDGSKVYFEYRKVGDSAWTRAEAAIEESEGVYAKVIAGLEPETEYECQLIVYPNGSDTAADPIAGKNFTTAVAPEIPNGSLEDVNTSGDYPLFYYTGEQWWDSGNKGSNKGGKTICSPDTNDYKDGSKSAKLTSVNAVIKFAAGNLFSGSFGELDGIAGGSVNFGRPFIGRPTKLKFWVKYQTGEVNYNQGDGPIAKNEGKYDIGQVKIALGTWDYTQYRSKKDPGKFTGNSVSPVCVLTTEPGTFVDFNTDASTIAYGDFQINGAASLDDYKANINGDESPMKGGDWHQVELELVYRNLTKFPTHIIISCAASKYGDYFNGSDSSIMWVDGFELIYDENVAVK